MAPHDLKLSIVVPAFNEAEGLADTVRSIRTSLAATRATFEIIIVDDGSTDDTRHVAARLGERLVVHGRNLGYGAALKTGLEVAAHELVGIIDADGTYPPAAFPELLSTMQGADMAVGARPAHSAAIPSLRRPAKWVVTKLAEYVTGTSIPDVNSGIRIFPKALAQQYMHILPDGFSFTTTLTVASLCDGYRVVYRPIEYFDRAGTSKIVPSNFIDFVTLVLRLTMLFRPLKLFLPVGLASLGAGLIKLIVDAALALTALPGRVGVARHLVSYTSLLLLAVGLQMTFAGMFADAITRLFSSTLTRKVPSRAIRVVGSEVVPLKPDAQRGRSGSLS